MNKKAIALALVLVIAMSGVFAATLTINDNPVANVTATLTAIIGDYFNHGFDNTLESTQFNSTLNIANAFETDPEFTYRYETNTTDDFVIKMTVGDFVNGSDSDVKIKIANVLVANVIKNNSTGIYTILDSTLSGTTGHALIKIQPMKNITVATDDHRGVEVLPADTEKFVNAEAIAGTYTSTVIISVDAS
jgi:hypothetical protein